MDQVISNAEQVTTAWLETVLRRSGALEAGRVAGFEVEAGTGTWSTNVRLRLRYSADAAGARPEALFLKMVDTNLDDEFFGDSEVTYYTRDYVDVEGAPLVRCYDALFSEAEQRYHLLLNDVSATHVRALDKTPTVDFGLAFAEGVARLHARWWGADGLREAGAPIHATDHIRYFADIALPGVEPQLRLAADELPPNAERMLREIFEYHPQLMVERAADLNGFTLIHGDPNPLNILVPKEGSRPLYLIDRQPFDWSLTSWLGAYDLAYMMVLWLEPAVRRELEKPVLERYHETLLQAGVRGYSREQLWDDYRLTTVQCVFVATEWCRGGVEAIAFCKEMQWLWQRELSYTLTAIADLDAAALWNG